MPATVSLAPVHWLELYLAPGTSLQLVVSNFGLFFTCLRLSQLRPQPTTWQPRGNREQTSLRPFHPLPTRRPPLSRSLPQRPLSCLSRALFLARPPDDLLPLLCFALSAVLMDTLSLKDYAALPPFAPSNAARYASVFEQLISALPTAVHPAERASLLKEIVEDVGREDYFSNECEGSSCCPLEDDDLRHPARSHGPHR